MRRVYEKLDASGVTLLDVVEAGSRKNRVEALQMFVMNVDVWGSYLPRKNDVPKLHVCRQYAHEKVKQAITAIGLNIQHKQSK